MNDGYTIKEYKGKIKDKEGKKDKFEIMSYEDKDPKIKPDGDKKVTKTFKAKVKEIDDKGNTGTEKTVEIEVEYEKGTMVHYGKIKKVNGQEVQPVDVGFAGNSFRWPFYTMIVVGVIMVGLLIWWLIASNKSEDKEEESL